MTEPRFKNRASVVAHWWAVLWTLNGALLIYMEEQDVYWWGVGNWLSVVVLLLIPWVAIEVARRNAGIGALAFMLGTVLSVDGVWLPLWWAALPFVGYRNQGNHLVYLFNQVLSLPTIFLAGLASILSVANWWRSEFEPRKFKD